MLSFHPKKSCRGKPIIAMMLEATKSLFYSAVFLPKARENPIIYPAATGGADSADLPTNFSYGSENCRWAAA